MNKTTAKEIARRIVTHHMNSTKKVLTVGCHSEKIEITCIPDRNGHNIRMVSGEHCFNARIHSPLHQHSYLPIGQGLMVLEEALNPGAFDVTIIESARNR